MAKAKEKAAVYTLPNTQTSLAEFYEREKVLAEAGEEGVDVPQPYQVPSVTRTDLPGRFEGTVSEEDQRAYVGVDEMYQNYPTVDEGEHTDKPRLPEEGPEAENFKRVLGEVEENPETDPGEEQKDTVPPPPPNPGA